MMKGAGGVHQRPICFAAAVVVRAMVAILVLAAVGCGSTKQHAGTAQSPANAATKASDFVGIYSDDVFYGNSSYRRDALAQQHDAGVELIRQPFAWADFDREPQRFDDFVGAAAQQHIKVLPVLVGPDPGTSRDDTGLKPPAQPERFAGWAALMVQRFGPKGSYWSDHPNTPKLPITSWQVWNEPNIKAWWSPTPDPAAYADLLNQTGAAIHKVDPDAEIVAAGLPTSHLGVAAPEFLAAAMKAGAKFDTAAVHPYAATPDEVVKRVQAIQKVAGADTKVWVTEVGWGTGGKSGPLTVSPDKQAAYVKETVTRLHDMGMRGVVVFQWHDPKPFAGRREIWPYYAGLLDADGKPKPSLEAFKQAAATVSGG